MALNLDFDVKCNKAAKYLLLPPFFKPCAYERATFSASLETKFNRHVQGCTKGCTQHAMMAPTYA